MKVCRRAVRRERLVRWVISMVSVVLVAGLRGDVVVSLLVLLGRGVSRWATVVVLEVWEGLGSSILSFSFVLMWSDENAEDSCGPANTRVLGLRSHAIKEIQLNQDPCEDEVDQRVSPVTTLVVSQLLLRVVSDIPKNGKINNRDRETRKFTKRTSST
jgi:hypothetical protein